MPDNISCSVEECTHNRNKHCRASAIEVLSNGDKVVKTSGGTACETFKPRG